MLAGAGAVPLPLPQLEAGHTFIVCDTNVYMGQGRSLLEQVWHTLQHSSRPHVQVLVPQVRGWYPPRTGGWWGLLAAEGAKGDRGRVMGW